MESSGGQLVMAAIVVGVTTGFGAIVWILSRFNDWFYTSWMIMEEEDRICLPPGDMGWPIIGNMWAFFSSFRSGNPDAFISKFVDRFGRTGIYRAFMFRSPTILVTIPETCKQVLMDDNFEPGWPTATAELMGKYSFVCISYEEHKRLRRLTASPINGPEALSTYLKFIESNVISCFQEWSESGPIELLTQIRKVTFRVIMHIFMSLEADSTMENLEREYTDLNYGIRDMAINLPGFAYHKALKARKKLVAILHSAVTQRRELRAKVTQQVGRKDMLDRLIEVEDENGRRLIDEEIVDLLIMYLNAGHESSAHMTMWVMLLVQEHPEIMQKAKAEAEEIVRRRPAGQDGLTYQEFKQMDYLSKVIDETMRLKNISLLVFRKATRSIKINGYTIPKDWRVQIWLRNVHLDPEVYTNPKEFNPSRWDVVPKAGSFIPFGAGSRLCPGNDLAKLEISIFLHYFLLGYRVERMNPNCPLIYLPHTRPTDNCLAIVRKVT